MGSIKLLLLVVVLYLSLSHYGVKGGMISISKEDDLEFERQLKSLNKPPLKTFLTETGEMVDCIDIYKQPAFDHPLLKNHKIQMRPTSHAKGLTDETKSVDDHSWFLGRSIRCPQGTVPIPRTRKEDLIRAKKFSNLYGLANIHPHSTAFPGQHIAAVRTKGDPNITYTAIKGHINVQNPRVGANQGSSTQMWVENARYNEIHSLQAGWMADAQLLGDNKTRLFVYWTANGKTGCFNFLCSGFVHVGRNQFVGGVIAPVSVYNGEQYSIKIKIFQDEGTANWWLTIGNEDINVGYWPRELVPHLLRGASHISWGGLARGPPVGYSPPMGSGYFPDGHYNHACWFKLIQVANTTNGYLVDPRKSDYETYVDCPECYGLDYDGRQGKELGHAILFGGPGGICNV